MPPLQQSNFHSHPLSWFHYLLTPVAINLCIKQNLHCLYHYSPVGINCLILKVLTWFRNNCSLDLPVSTWNYIGMIPGFLSIQGVPWVTPNYFKTASISLSLLLSFKGLNIGTKRTIFIPASTYLEEKSATAGPRRPVRASLYSFLVKRSGFFCTKGTCNDIFWYF